MPFSTKGADLLVAGVPVGDQHVHLARRADQAAHDAAELAAVGHHDALRAWATSARLIAASSGLRQVSPRSASIAFTPMKTLSRNTSRAPARRRRAHEREPAAAQVAAGDVHREVLAIAQLHRHVDGARHHGDALAVAQAARDLGRGRARGEADRLAVLHQLGGGEPDAPLLLDVPALLLLERGVVSERLVEQRAHGHRSAVRAPHQALALQLREVAAHRRSGDPEPLRESLHRDLALAQHLLDDRGRALVHRCSSRATSRSQTAGSARGARRTRAARVAGQRRPAAPDPGLGYPVRRRAPRLRHRPVARVRLERPVGEHVVRRALQPAQRIVQQLRIERVHGAERHRLVADVHGGVRPAGRDRDLVARARPRPRSRPSTSAVAASCM